MIYLDHAATTPISDGALEVYTKVAKQYYGNASSLHDEGSAAKQILEASAKTIASTLNARSRDIYFTSGATESNFLAIYSLLAAKKGKHIITTPLEHSSVWNVFLKLQKEGYELTFLSVDEFGAVSPKELEQALRDDTVLASIQHVNSETGTIQDIAKLGGVLREHKVILHSDCVQSYGRIPVDVQRLNVDAISVSSHKIYGPKGVGAVWVNPEIDWKPMLPDPETPKKLKQGTSDVPSIAAFATAAKEITQRREEEQERIWNFRTKLVAEILKMDFEVEVEEHPDQKIPNILGLRFPGMEGQFLMLECNQAGLAISTGSACQVGSDQPNKTMMAIGKSEQEAREFVRLSFGKENNEKQISEIIEKMNSILQRHFDKVNHYRTKG
ncbi:MAG: IscS subfamily cysteine desulfurase [Gracilimonas sp.]|uniref:IscS subfamily cysteine desulfurase n=1 Tax=Gracilimonas sp. TaxID=1974203 RepID=UPI0019B528C9|nr:IscS subfamily cysteine desulfurase [Gracilimonas sp.]MBD3617210.1 IscS subfamily cysteine desulfurase [Gracilimonas sp.]